MIVTVRRWTNIALPRLARRAKSVRIAVPKTKEARPARPGFLETFNKMFEHQVNLMFKDDLNM